MKFNKLGGYGVVGPDRGTGQSLSLALKYLSEAIANPGMRVPIVDHYPTKVADAGLFKMVCQLTDKLGLKHICMYSADFTISYDIYSDVEYPEVVLCEGRLLSKFDIPDNLVYIDEVPYKPV